MQRRASHLLSLTEKWKNLFCMLPIICECTSIRIIIYIHIIIKVICTCQHIVMVDNVSHYNILSFVFFILYSISVSDSEFFGDIIHALCINSTLTNLKLGENILGELFQVCACSQTSIKSSKHGSMLTQPALPAFLGAGVLPWLISLKEKNRRKIEPNEIPHCKLFNSPSTCCALIKKFS